MGKMITPQQSLLWLLPQSCDHAIAKLELGRKCSAFVGGREVSAGWHHWVFSSQNSGNAVIAKKTMRFGKVGIRQDKKCRTCLCQRRKDPMICQGALVCWRRISICLKHARCPGGCLKLQMLCPEPGIKWVASFGPIKFLRWPVSVGFADQILSREDLSMEIASALDFVSQCWICCRVTKGFVPGAWSRISWLVVAKWNPWSGLTGRHGPSLSVGRPLSLVACHHLCWMMPIGWMKVSFGGPFVSIWSTFTEPAGRFLRFWLTWQHNSSNNCNSRTNKQNNQMVMLNHEGRWWRWDRWHLLKPRRGHVKLRTAVALHVTKRLLITPSHLWSSVIAGGSRASHANATIPPSPRLATLPSRWSQWQ